MRESPTNVRVADLARLCSEHFGEPRNSQGGSHRTYKTPWPGDPRVNIQNMNGMAKTYRVRQVLSAIDGMMELGHAG